MRKNYKCSNVKFCMEDENQRRTWEYLQTKTRKEGSYGKMLSDAFVAVLDGKVRSKTAEDFVVSQEQPAGGLEETLDCLLDKKFQELLANMQEFFAVEISRWVKRYVSDAPDSASRLTDDDDMDGVRQIQAEELSEEMMDFAFAMGE